MPFDGDMKKFETKPDVFSLEGLIAWLETQVASGRAEEHYNFMCVSGGCLIGQYLIAETGRNWPEHGLRWGDFDDDHPHLVETAGGYLLGEPLDGPAYTFGAALERARALLASRGNE